MLEKQFLLAVVDNQDIYEVTPTTAAPRARSLRARSTQVSMVQQASSRLLCGAGCESATEECSFRLPEESFAWKLGISVSQAERAIPTVGTSSRPPGSKRRQRTDDLTWEYEPPDERWRRTRSKGKRKAALPTTLR